MASLGLRRFSGSACGETAPEPARRRSSSWSEPGRSSISSTLSSVSLGSWRSGESLSSMASNFFRRRSSSSVATTTSRSSATHEEQLGGKPANGRIKESKRRSSIIFGGSQKNRTQTFLESARSGDLDSLKKAAQGSLSSGLFGPSRLDVNCSDSRGKTALMHASAFGRRNIVEYLLFQKFGVNVNGKDDAGKSALHHAAKITRSHPGLDDEQAALMQVLLDGGAAVDVRDKEGVTPLMFAAAHGDQAIATVLLQAKADVNLMDDEGLSPLDYTEYFGHHAIAKLLLNSGPAPALGNTDDADSDWSDFSQDSHASLDAVFEELGGASSSRSTVLPGGDGAETKPQSRLRSKTKVKVKIRAKGGAKGKAKARPQDKVEDSAPEAAPSVPELQEATFFAEDVGREYAMNANEHGVKSPITDIGVTDEKGIATNRLLDIVHSGAMPSETESEVQGASDAGADAQSLREAGEATRVLTTISENVCNDAVVKKKVSVRRRRVSEGCVAVAKKRPTDTGEAGAKKQLTETDDAVVSTSQISSLAAEKATTETRLSAIASAATVPKSEGTIRAARVAGAEPDALSMVEGKVASVNRKASALDALRAAMEGTLDTKTMTAAIAEAEGSGVSAAELTPARGALRLMEQREKARNMLLEARDSGSSDKLKIAIGWAQKAKLSSREISFFEELLLKAECKEAAIEALKAAMVLKDADRLRPAVEHAREVGIEDISLSVAERALREAEAKLKARAAIRKALETEPLDTAALAAAIRQGKRTHLQPSEYAECEAALKQAALEEQEVASAKDAAAATRDIDISSMEELSSASTSYTSLGALSQPAEVSCSPASANMEHTNNSLRYAGQARKTINSVPRICDPILKQTPSYDVPKRRESQPDAVPESAVEGHCSIDNRRDSIYRRHTSCSAHALQRWNQEIRDVMVQS